MSKKINVFGLGRVGLITAFNLAAQGHQVRGVDLSDALVDQLKQGADPFAEPGFPERLALYRERLNFSVDFNPEASIHFVCVPTNFDPDQNKYDLSNLHSVLEQIGDLSGTVVVRSTVSPGTCREIAKSYPALNVVYMPEFFREGQFVKDSQENKSLVLAGSETELVQSLYDLPPSFCEVCSWEEAEILKLSSNLYHGLKVTFANEIGRLAARYHARPSRIMDLFCRDEEANLSARYLNPGFAYGGPCLVKDISAFTAEDNESSLRMDLSSAVAVSNQSHIDWVTTKICNCTRGSILILGASFKASGKSLKDSPVLSLANIMRGRGIRTFATESAFQEVVDEVLPLDEALAKADLVVHGNYLWNDEAIKLITDSQLPIVDLLTSPIPEALRDRDVVTNPFEMRD